MTSRTVATATLCALAVVMLLAMPVVPVIVGRWLS